MSFCGDDRAVVPRILWAVIALVMVCSYMGCSDTAVDVENDVEVGAEADVGISADAEIDIGDDIAPQEPCADVNCDANESCYRGVCYSSCNSDAECGDDERCFDDDHCAPLNCDGVICGEHESCYRGVCYAFCEDDAQCGDELLCTEGACVSPCEELECGDEEQCYRGVCYPSCDVQSDCDSDARCDEDRCLPLDCSTVECRQDEACFYGVCYGYCDSEADCTEPDALCEDNACVVTSCDDGLQNGLETDVDCGGPDCVGCEGGQRCEVDSDCRSQVCEDQVCVGDLNACGGIEPLAEMPGEACGPCELDVYRCDGEDAVSCSGNTECNDLLSDDVEVTNIDENSATLEGEIVSLPPTALGALSFFTVTEHGFCWDTDADPSSDDDHCESLGEVEEAGVFSINLSGLEANTEYYVVAFAATNTTTITSSEVVFLTPSPPTSPMIPSVSASDDLNDRVTVSWSEIGGADGYIVYRDGIEIADVDGSTTSFDDFEADDAPAPDAPQITSVSDDLVDGVEITWSEANTQPGTAHNYEVTLVDGSTESAPGEDVGQKAAPSVTGYEICIGGSCDDSAWSEVDTTDGLSHLDGSAPLGAIDGGTADASEGEFDAFVRLSADDWQVEEADEQVYQIRAVSEAGEGAGSSEDDGWGRRDTGSLRYEWFGSALDASGNFSSIYGPAEDGFEYEDDEALEDGTERQYYVRLSAGGAATLEYPDPISPLTGFRATGADVVTLSARDIESNSATLRGRLDSYGAPVAVEAGLCWNDAEPAEDGSCEAVEPLVDEGEVMELNVSPLASGREYFLRAYSESEDGIRTYGSHRSFFTLPQAPTGVSAIPGDGEVEVQWDTPTYGGASSISSYTATASPGGESCSTTGGADDTSCTVTGLTNGESYTVTVVATNTTGDSEPSQPSPQVMPTSCGAELFAGGDGSVGAPYEIETASQLNTIGTLDDCLYKSFVVLSDIDLDDLPAGDGFNIIGSDWDEPFAGLFDGNGQSIRNLSIDASGDHVGFFGVVNEDGQIENVALEDVDISSNGSSVGGLVGTNDGSIVESYASGAVSGEGQVGGLVGTSTGAITQSSAMVQVEGSEADIGGLLGLNSGGDVTDSFAAGDVEGTSFVGGLVGLNTDGGAQITGSYATGGVFGQTTLGGLVGYNSDEISQSYATGSVTGDNQMGGLVGHNHTNDGSISGSYASGSVNSDNDEVGGLVGRNEESTISDSYWDTQTSAPVGVGVGLGDDTGVEGLENVQFDNRDGHFDAWLSGGSWVIAAAPDGEVRPIFEWQIVTGCNPYQTPFGGGSGDSQDPYLICSADQLNAVGAEDNIENLERDYLVVQDIDMGDIEAYNIIAQPDDWEDEEKRFGGVFDGGGQTIRNLSVNDSEEFVGFIGWTTESAEVRDVVLDNVDIAGDEVNVGGFVGFNEGTITNAHISGSVSGSGDVGAIAGQNLGSIDGCTVAATVQGGGDMYVGGLVGWNEGSISDSYVSNHVTAEQSEAVGGLAGSNTEGGNILRSYVTASVEVSGRNRVGGLVGSVKYDAEIRASYALGTVRASGTRVGGLAGRNNRGDIIDSYAIGSVEGNDYVGGLVGFNAQDSNITRSYSAGSVLEGTGDGGSVGGFIGANDAQATSSYWDTQTGEPAAVGVGTGDEDGVEGLESDEFSDSNNFDPPWDFSDIWMIGEVPDDPAGPGTERPILQWQD